MLKPLRGIARQRSREKFAILTLKPQSHVRIFMYRTWAFCAGYFRNEKVTGAEIPPAIVSGIVTGKAPVCYWLIFFPVSINSPRSLCDG